MKMKNVANCADFYQGYYSDVSYSVVSKCYSWSEAEKIDLLPLAEGLLRSGFRTHLYLFMTKTCSYPISFYDSLFGLWRDIKKRFKLQTIQEVEKSEEMIGFSLLYGVCKIPLHCMKQALELLKIDRENSWLLLSNTDFQTVSRYGCVIDRHSLRDYHTNYSALINSIKRDDVFITWTAQNSNELINIFYRNRKMSYSEST